MLLSSLIADFLKYQAEEKRAQPKTLENYGHYLRRFEEFILATDKKKAPEFSPLQITLPLVKKYRSYLDSWSDPKNKKRLKRKTQNYFLIALRAFLNYLALRGVVSLPFDQVLLLEGEINEVKVLDSNSLERLLETPNVLTKEGLRDKAILLTLFSTGLLVSELAALNCNTVNLDQGEFFIKGKGGQERMVTLSPMAIKWLDQYIKSRKDPFQPLFIRYQGIIEPENDGEKMRLTSRSIQRIMEKYVKLAGLSVKATPQTLRHSKVSDMLQNGLELNLVKETLGHKTLASTQNLASHLVGTS